MKATSLINLVTSPFTVYYSSAHIYIYILLVKQIHNDQINAIHSNAKQSEL